MAKRERWEKNAPKRNETSQRHTACRPQKLRMWSDGSMLGAMNAVAEGEMGINRAAL